MYCRKDKAKGSSCRNFFEISNASYLHDDELIETYFDIWRLSLDLTPACTDALPVDRIRLDLFGCDYEITPTGSVIQKRNK